MTIMLRQILRIPKVLHIMCDLKLFRMHILSIAFIPALRLLRIYIYIIYVCTYVSICVYYMHNCISPIFILYRQVKDVFENPKITVSNK